MIVTNVGRGAVDATVSGAQAVAGRIKLREPSSGVRRTALKRTGEKRVGPTPRRWRQVLRRRGKPNRVLRASFRKATETRQPATPG